MSGPILGPCSPDRIVKNYQQARLTDITIGWCGHTGVIVTGSPDHQTNNLPTARIGDAVTGCNIGVIVTGADNHITDEP